MRPYVSLGYVNFKHTWYIINNLQRSQIIIETHSIRGFVSILLERAANTFGDLADPVLQRAASSIQLETRLVFRGLRLLSMYASHERAIGMGTYGRPFAKQSCVKWGEPVIEHSFFETEAGLEMISMQLGFAWRKLLHEWDPFMCVLNRCKLVNSLIHIIGRETAASQ